MYKGRNFSSSFAYYYYEHKARTIGARNFCVIRLLTLDIIGRRRRRAFVVRSSPAWHFHNAAIAQPSRVNSRAASCTLEVQQLE